MAQKFTVPIVVRNLSASSSDALAVSVDGDTHDRIKFEAGGRIVWGTGASAGDVNLYRPSADLLKTDDAFQAAGVITLTSDGPPTAALPDGALAVDTTNETLYVRANNAWVVASGGGGASVTVSDTAPLDPEQGDLWFESDTGDIYVYYSSTWVDIGGSSVANIAVTTTPPSSPVNGDLWFDTDTAKTYVYYNDGTSGQWVEIGAASAAASGQDGYIQFATGGTFNSASALVWDNANAELEVTGTVIADNVTTSGTTTSGTTATTSLTVDSQYVTPYTGRRNLLYNGAMQVHQRGTSSSGVTTSGYRTVDRWLVAVGGSGTWTESVENDAPSGSGFTKSFKQLVTTAVSSLSSGANHSLIQRLEGQDLQHLKKGTSSAESLTLSFWVKSNVTGTYVVNLYDNDNTRIIGSAYTVNSSATWEKKVITFAGDTAGVLGNDNQSSLQLEWWLMAGSTFSSGTVHSTWQTPVLGNYAAGQVNLFSAVNNYWQVTGVQLEVGDKSTPFEHRLYGEELALCERYFQLWRGYDDSQGANIIGYGNGYNSTNIFPQINYKRQMRDRPSAISGSFTYANDVTSAYVMTSIFMEQAGVDGMRIQAIIAGGGVQYRGYGMTTNNNSTSFFSISAEL